MGRLAELDILSCFIGPGGNTYCCEAKGPSSAQASILYAPLPEVGPSIRFTTRNFQVKQIFDGSRADGARKLYPSVCEVLPDLYEIDPNTNQRVIAVPDSDIDEVFNPQASLKDLLGNTKNTPEEVKEKLKIIVDFLVNHGIPLDALGLYGGLQSFVKPVNNHMKDVDITVLGLDYVPLINDLVRESKKTHPEPIDVEGGMVRPPFVRIYMPTNDQLFCDLKVLRLPADRQSFTHETKIQPATQTIKGEVVDVLEGMSFPTSYGISDNIDGKIITVSSTRYHFCNALTMGDRVQLTAAQTNQPNHLLLTDDKGHGIKFVHRTLVNFSNPQ